MENMGIAQVAFDFAKHIDDWMLAMKHASFSHREECEFIFSLGGNDQEYQIARMEEYKKLGFSQDFLRECAVAIGEGFQFLCLYDG